MWAKINRYYPPWLELVIWVLFTTAFSYIRAHYDQIPGTVPSHFGASGTPDAWVTKSPWSVYGILLIGFGIYLSMTLMNIFMIIRPEDPSKIINIPQRDKDLLGPVRMEAIRTFTVRSMVVLNTILAAMFAYMAYGAANIAMGIGQSLGPIMWVFLFLILLISLYLTVKLMTMCSTRSLKNSRK